MGYDEASMGQRKKDASKKLTKMVYDQFLRDNRLKGLENITEKSKDMVKYVKKVLADEIKPSSFLYENL